MDKKPKEKNAMMLIHDVAKTFRDVMRKKSENEGITDCYRPILMMLRFNDGCTQHDIVKWTHFKAPTISLTLNKMEQLSLIKRVENDVDKRIINIFITEEGKKMDEKIRELIKETEEEFFKNLSTDDLKYLEDILKHILGNVLTNKKCCDGGND